MSDEHFELRWVCVLVWTCGRCGRALTNHCLLRSVCGQSRATIQVCAAQDDRTSTVKQKKGRQSALGPGISDPCVPFWLVRCSKVLPQGRSQRAAFDGLSWVGGKEIALRSCRAAELTSHFLFLCNRQVRKAGKVRGRVGIATRI